MGKAKQPATQSKAKPPKTTSSNEPSQPETREHLLSVEREAELMEEANGLGDNLIPFPGRFAPRAAWLEKIYLAADRDAADLIRTPFADDEPPITKQEIDGFREKIALLRITQSRWTAVQKGQKAAIVEFDKDAAEAAQHKEKLLRFFALRFKNNPEGQKRVSNIRAGSGDSDLVQDVSDILTLCQEHSAAIAKGPKGEGESAGRLQQLGPKLSYLLATKALSPKAQQARKQRDAAYTLVVITERRFRAAGEYWYGGADKMKDYSAFAASSTSSSGDDEEDEGTEGGEAPQGGKGTPSQGG